MEWGASRRAATPDREAYSAGAHMEDVGQLRRGVELDDHRLSLRALAERYGTSLCEEDPARSEGLTQLEARAKLRRDGPNRLTPPVRRPEWQKFLDQFKGLFQLLLLLGGLLCFLSYAVQPVDVENFYLGWILWGVVVLTSAFAYVQEAQSERLLEGFKSLTSTTTRVVRSGVFGEVDATELVVGDVVVLKAGDRIPADLRILAAAELKVDNSSLTGEAEALTRSPRLTDEHPLETENLAFFGTLCPEGEGVGVVVAVGDGTVLGRIAALATQTGGEDTPLKKELRRFMHLITAVALALGGVAFVLGAAIEREVSLHHIVFVIGLIVASIPEGTLPMVTVALTLSAMRLKGLNVLAKNLEAVETLGSTTAIASDKTGTLTQNRMTVAHVFYPAGGIRSARSGTSDEVELLDPLDPDFVALRRCAALCSRAEFDPRPSNMARGVAQRRVLGDASESALLKFCEPLECTAELRRCNAKLSEIPFSSATKYHMTAHAAAGGGYVLLMKGAPERVLARCGRRRLHSEDLTFTDADKEVVVEAMRQLSHYGERVLGFAACTLEAGWRAEDLSSAALRRAVDAGVLPGPNLCFLGLAALVDPPRPMVPDAIARCHSASVKVYMVTGDHPFTAQAIARQVGIIGEESPVVCIDSATAGGAGLWAAVPSASAVVVTGTEIDRLQALDWDNILSREGVVFARTTPQQKLAIVGQLQARGHVVAVTGDGVNDSPALKKADVGIAMGITGSEVSKEAAKLILLDDNFGSIVNGVEEGRTIFDNLRKSICYTLCSNLPEVVPFLAYSLFALPLPMSTICILCVDLGTDIVPAIALAYELPESDIMQRPPRNPAVDNLVSARLLGYAYAQIGVIQASAGLYTYFYVMEELGYDPASLVGAARRHFRPLLDPRGLPFAGKGVARNLVDLAVAQSAAFCTIVTAQWATILCTKTRRSSLFTSFISNNQLILGLVFETTLAVLLVYAPGVSDVFNMAPIPARYWLCGLPYALAILAYDEIRKHFIRRQGDAGWVAQWSLW